jgi:hypothetical protein
MLATGVGVFDRIHDETLAANAASFDVQSIPATYAHLRLILAGRCTTAANFQTVLIRFNNDSTAIYDRMLWFRFGATGEQEVSDVAQTSGYLADLPAASATAGRAGQAEALIANYAGTTFHKTMSVRTAEGAGTVDTLLLVEHATTVWRSASAINRITLLPSADNFLAGTRLTIYGMG